MADWLQELGRMPSGRFQGAGLSEGLLYLQIRSYAGCGFCGPKEATKSRDAGLRQGVNYEPCRCSSILPPGVSSIPHYAPIDMQGPRSTHSDRGRAQGADV